MELTREVTPSRPPLYDPGIRAILAGLSAILLWSLGAPLTHELRHIPATQLLVYTGAVNATATLAFLWKRQRFSVLSNAPMRVWLTASFLLCMSQFSYILAFQNAPPEEADLINYLWPLMVVCASYFLPHEDGAWPHILAAVVGLFAIWLLLSEGSLSLNLRPHHLVGHAAAFTAAVSFASFTLYCRMQGPLPSEATGILSGLSAGIVALFQWGCGGTLHALAGWEWGYILIMGLTVNGISYALWQYSLQRGPLELIGLLSYLTPLLSIVWLVLWGKAGWSWYLGVSTCLVCLAAWIPQFFARKGRIA